jgi:hypothetical protein
VGYLHDIRDLEETAMLGSKVPSAELGTDPTGEIVATKTRIEQRGPLEGRLYTVKEFLCVSLRTQPCLVANMIANSFEPSLAYCAELLEEQQVEKLTGFTNGKSEGLPNWLATHSGTPIFRYADIEEGDAPGATLSSTDVFVEVVRGIGMKPPVSFRSSSLLVKLLSEMSVQMLESESMSVQARFSGLSIRARLSRLVRPLIGSHSSRDSDAESWFAGISSERALCLWEVR